MMTETDHMWQVLNLRYGSNLQAATVTLLLKDGDKAVRFVTITIPQTGSDLPTTGWRKRQIALDIKAENARELGLDYEPDKTIEMAREVNAVFDVMAMGRHDGILFTSKELKAFEALVRAEEREACAKLCEEIHNKQGAYEIGQAFECAEAIRGQA